MTKSPSGGKPREFWLYRPDDELGREDHDDDIIYTTPQDPHPKPGVYCHYIHVREVTEQDKAEGETMADALCKATISYESRKAKVGGIWNDFYHGFEYGWALKSPTPASPGEVRVTADLIKELADNCLASTAESDVSAERIKYRKDLYKRTMDEIEKSGGRE